MRILVVDDSADAAGTLQMLLKLDGHDAQVAYDGPEALDAIDLHWPEIIILDLAMPVMTGFEVARQVRKEREHAHIILIAMTGHGRESDVSDSIECGFDYHFVKPTAYPAIKALLDRIGSERESL